MQDNDLPYKTLAQFKAENGNLSEEAFVQKHPSAFLVLDIPLPLDEDVEFETFSPKTAGRTVTGRSPLRKAMEPRHTSTEKCVFCLAKPEGDYHMVTIGRTSNNDIYIPHSQISKFHAYFKKDAASGRIGITDADSTNGTQVNAMDLPAKELRLLEQGDRVVFGEEVPGVFYLSAGMWALIAQG